jgi:hypothetical protein
VFVLIDDENVTEIEHPAVVIPASEWAAYSSERFPAEVRAWQAQLDRSPRPTPNRAARDARKAET